MGLPHQSHVAALAHLTSHVPHIYLAEKDLQVKSAVMSKESAHNSANEKLVDAVHEGIHDETDEETHGNTQDGPQEARQSPFPPLSVLTISSDGFAAPQLEKITDASEIKAHVLTDGPAAVDAETGTIPRAEHKIFILNGVHFAHACAAAAALDVDPAFIDAHLCRQRYVPSLSAHRRRQRAQCFHLDFPQLEKLAVPFNHPAMKPDQGILALELGYDAFPKEFVRPAAVDAMTAIQVPAPALVSVAYSSAYLRPYVLFQRVSWWRGSSTSRNCTSKRASRRLTSYDRLSQSSLARDL